MRQLPIWILLAFCVLAACTPADTEPLPTLIDLPTATETFTPSATFTVTNTITPTFTNTATITPTATLTHTPTQTFTPTNTPTITRTPRPLPTATRTLTPTPSSTFTPLPTNTPLATATSALPSIINFSSNVTTASAGSQAQLRWEATGDSATLELLNATGGIITTTSVPLIGNTSVTLPTTGSQAIYRLTVVRGVNTTNLSLSIALQPLCTTAWFFTTTPPPGIGCPAAIGQSYIGSYQPFERGAFFRIVIGALDRVCGIQNDLQLYTCYPYGVYSGTPSVTPVPNTSAPAPEFAAAYYNNLAIGGTWNTVIGWGTTGANATPLNAQLGQNNKLYIQLPLGIYEFDGTLTSGALVKVQ